MCFSSGPAWPRSMSSPMTLKMLSKYKSIQNKHSLANIFHTGIYARCVDEWDKGSLEGDVTRCNAQFWQEIAQSTQAILSKYQPSEDDIVIIKDDVLLLKFYTTACHRQDLDLMTEFPILGEHLALLAVNAQLERGSLRIWREKCRGCMKVAVKAT